jgi:hypothetical protein
MMNQRTQELLQEATQEILGVNQTNWSKFAMLIVQECIEQAHSVAEMRGVNDDIIYGADIAAVRIAKHFGIQ